MAMSRPAKRTKLDTDSDDSDDGGTFKVLMILQTVLSVSLVVHAPV